VAFKFKIKHQKTFFETQKETKGTKENKSKAAE
jgi:hypothetical protein